MGNSLGVSQLDFLGERHDWQTLMVSGIQSNKLFRPFPSIAQGSGRVS